MSCFEEVFVYESYDRLTEIGLGGVHSGVTPSGTFPSVPLTVSYTGFDKALKVKQGSDSLIYRYGHDHQRVLMEERLGNTRRTKRYVGNCEFVNETNGNNSSSNCLTYLTGPTGVYAVVETQNGTHTLHYILKDNLGSWNMIPDSTGMVEQRLSYDAWGNLRDPGTWSGSYTGTPMFDRGFTGHEHLYDLGLINMNGRMYDPMMSSFLSVDQFVQGSDNSQGFNRYAYCLNNPLRYTDPSGWRMKPTPGRTPSSNDYYRDIYSYVERALEPRDLGLLQLPENDPSVVWMEENEMHGGGTVVTKGGWYRSGNEICWSPIASSQSELDELGIKGTFLGHNYIDEKNHMYYGIIGKKYDLTTFDGKMAQKIEESIINHIEYQNAIKNSESEPIEKSTDFKEVTNYSVDCFGWGTNNRVEFYYEGAKGYFYQYNPNDSRNKLGILAKFGSWPTKVSRLNTYGFPGSIIEGYQIFFPKTNAVGNNIPVVILVFPNSSSGLKNYNNYYNSIRSSFPTYP